MQSCLLHPVIFSKIVTLTQGEVCVVSNVSMYGYAFLREAGRSGAETAMYCAIERLPMPGIYS